MCLNAHAEVRGYLCGISSLLPCLCEFRDLNGKCLYLLCYIFGPTETCFAIQSPQLTLHLHCLSHMEGLILEATGLFLKSPTHNRENEVARTEDLETPCC